MMIRIAAFLALLVVACSGKVISLEMKIIEFYGRQLAGKANQC